MDDVETSDIYTSHLVILVPGNASQHDFFDR